MRSITRLLLISAIAVASIFSYGAQSFADEFHNDQGISRASLARALSRDTDLTPQQVDSLIGLLEQQFQVAPNQKIPISGYLYTSGMNGAFFVDHDSWVLDATLVDPNTGKLVDIPRLFLCDFHNGGIKIEVAYKWMFTFIPQGMTVSSLNGAVFGRGIGGVWDSLLGFEASWMPGQNRPGSLLHVALKLGLGAGLVFPKMEFKLRRVVGNKVGDQTVMAPKL